jgi:hypothetical protein
MESKIREVSAREVALAQQMFKLGMDVSMTEHKSDFEWVAYKKNEILTHVSNDAAMTDLLKHIFECGKSVGERKKKKEMPNT